MKIMTGVLVAVLIFAGVSANAQDAEPAELTAMRVQYEEALKAAVLPVMRAYGRKLRDKMTESTQAGNLDEALAYKKEMERVAAEIMAAAKAGVGDTAAGGVSSDRRRGAINLLELIDIEIDGKPKDKWRLDGGELQCVKGSFVPKIILPYEPPEEYDLTMTFEQPRLRNGVTFLIPNRAGGIFVVAAAGGNGTSAGLMAEGLDGKYSSRKEDWFRPDRDYTLEVEVRRESVKGKVDGNTIFEYEGDLGTLKLENMFFRVDAPNQLAISADDPAVFTKLEVREVTGKGNLLREK